VGNEKVPPSAVAVAALYSDGIYIYYVVSFADDVPELDGRLAQVVGGCCDASSVSSASTATGVTTFTRRA